MATRSFFFKDFGVEVQDPRSGSSIASAFAACRDLTRCGSRYLEGNAAGALNARDGCQNSPVVYLTGNQGFTLLGDNPAPEGIVPPNTDFGGNFLPLTQYAVSAGLAANPSGDDGTFSMGDPTIINADLAWEVRGRQHVASDKNSDAGGELIYSVSFPRISPIMDQCGIAIGARVKATVQQTFYTPDCQSILYAVYRVNYAWNATAFTAIDTIVGALGTLMEGSYPDGGPPAFPAAGEDTCGDLSTVLITNWRDTNIPRLTLVDEPGLVITDDAAEV